MIESFKLPVITPETLTGSICSFNDEYGGLPLKSCVSQISGYQEGSGTPSPDNVRPLHAFLSASLGVNTINQWDEQWEVGYINETTGQVQAGNKFISKNFIPCLPNTQYRKLGTLGVAPAYYGWLLFYYYDENHNFIGHDSQWTADGVFTTPANCHFMKFRSYSNCSSYGNDISINHPSSDENYHAFNGAVFTFGQSIYQGYIDWKRGVVVGEYGYYALNGTEDWSIVGSGTGLRAFIANVVPNKKPSANGICNCFKYGSAETVGEFDLAADYLRFNVYGIATTKAEFNTWLTNNPTSIAYELATPIEIPLGGINLLTQEGQNNIYCDTGDTEVKWLHVN